MLDDAGLRLLDVAVLEELPDEPLTAPLATSGPQQDSDETHGAVPSAL